MSGLTEVKYSVKQIHGLTPANILDFRAIKAGVESRTVYDWMPDPGEFIMSFGAYEIDNIKGKKKQAKQVGLAMLRGNYQMARIGDLAVDRDYPRKAVGPVLIEAMLTAALDMDIERIELADFTGTDHDLWLMKAARHEGFVFEDDIWVYPVDEDQAANG
jgi:GNAT superfamily N-acetyltransferase